MNYREAVLLIDSSTDEGEEALVSIKSAFSEHVNESAFDYRKAVDQIETVKTQPRGRQKVQPQAARQEANAVSIERQRVPGFMASPIQGEHYIFKPEEGGAGAAEGQRAPLQKPGKEKLLEKAPVAVQREGQDARAMADMARIASVLGKGPVPDERQEQAAKPYSGKALLPTFSVRDQISELEKISEGLDEGAFSADQLSMIRFEIGELRKSINDRSAEAGVPELVQIRDARLKILVDKMNGSE